MADDRSYKDDEVRAIIDRALKKQPDGGVTHEELLAIGAGVGLSRAALESAALELQEARLNEAATQRVVSERRRGVAAHAFVFAAVNGFLFLINRLTTPGEWWVLFPVLAWGLGLLLHAGFSLSSTVSPARLRWERSRLKQRASGAAPKGSTERPGGVRVAEAPTPSLPAQAGEQPDEITSGDDRARPSPHTTRDS
jgi:hypothetical protein